LAEATPYYYYNRCIYGTAMNNISSQTFYSLPLALPNGHLQNISVALAKICFDLPEIMGPYIKTFHHCNILT